MDVHVKRGITDGLRDRGIDVLTAQEDDSDRLADPDLLDRAGILGRILVSMDADLLREANRRLANGIDFVGLAYSHQERISVGQAVRDLQLLAEVLTAAEMRNQVEYLPY
ncbi:MAG: hypothetical protein EXS05_12000 [Planctomycetaceae bacterium]|nr:hypothetical protein [Planctomycetaceae bacterium]